MALSACARQVTSLLRVAFSMLKEGNAQIMIFWKLSKATTYVKHL